MDVNRFCDDSERNNNVPLAFALTLAAGLSTTIGSLVPFCVDLKNPIYLAAALGLASGVMLYISLVEVLAEARMYLACATKHDGVGTVGFFFLGIAVTILLKNAVHKMEHCYWARKDSLKAAELERLGGAGRGGADDFELEERGERASYMDEEYSSSDDEDMMESVDDSIMQQQQEQAELEYREGAATSAGVESGGGGIGRGTQRKEEMSAGYNNHHRRKRMRHQRVKRKQKHISTPQMSQAKEEDSSPTWFNNEEEQQKLKRMGLMTGLAVAIHNFPEGIATLVATLSNRQLGAAVALAVAVHNIPEGICVSMPLYYATGSKLKALFWGFLSGVSEPIGAVLGYLLLMKLFSPMVYGILFGLIAGMMVYITVHELLPTAHRYDPTDQVVSYFVVVGMAVMGVSLLLFEY